MLQTGLPDTLEGDLFLGTLDGGWMGRMYIPLLTAFILSPLQAVQCGRDEFGSQPLHSEFLALSIMRTLYPLSPCV